MTSQQLDSQHELTVPQQEVGAQAGAEQTGVQVSQQVSQDLLRRAKRPRRLGFSQQSLTVPQHPSEQPQDAEATGAACTAVPQHESPALTVVSSTKKTFTGVILRCVRDFGGRWHDPR